MTHSIGLLDCIIFFFFLLQFISSSTSNVEIR